MKKLFTLIIIAIICFVACGTDGEQVRKKTRAERAEQRRQDSLALKVAVLPTIDAMPLFVAQERGLFTRLDVDVRLKPYNAQMDVDTALLGGSVEGAMTDLVRVERMKQQGLSLVCLSSTQSHWQLIGNRTARLKEPKQLGDKMVAMTRYSATDLLTDEALKGEKTSAAVYRVQINDVLLRMQMLRNNEMDALWLPEPHATEARLAGHSVLWDTQKKDFRLGVMAFRQKALADKRIKEQTDKLLKAYNMACDSLNQKGLAAYADIIELYCHTDLTTAKALPKLTFVHAKAPREQDVSAARTWLNAGK